MLLTEYRALTKNGINRLTENSAQEERIIVQVNNISIGKNQKISCSISDGRYLIKALFRQKNVLNPETDEGLIICITQHVLADSGQKIGIISFQRITKHSKIIGNPTTFNLQTSAQQNPEDQQSFLLDVNYVQKDNKLIFQKAEKAVSQNITKSNTKELIKMEEENNQIKKQFMPQKTIQKQIKKPMALPAPKPLNQKVNQFETIKGLFIGLRGWHLLCRIVKLDYQQFLKKGTDKLTKLLTVQLIDRSDVKISGAFFGQAAEKFKQQLKLDSIYKISQGSIQNQTYNNTKNAKLSPFRLVFNINSIFQQVSDVKIVGKAEDSALNLGDLLRKGVIDQQFDIVGILVQIQQIRQITKGQKMLKMCNWVIADPFQEKLIDAVFWNDKIKFDASLIGRAILLSRFTLHKYNESFTLNSKIRSSVQILKDHQLNQFQQKAMSDFKNYENVSQKRRNNTDSKSINLKNLKQLKESVENLMSGENIKTDLVITLSKMNLKQWFYEGCPSCQKSVEKGSSCHNCNKYVQETIPHFIMGVQISDAFGSIWTTAYDDQAKKIFANQEGAIHKLIKYDLNQLKEVTQDYLFQEFRVQIYTKKDQVGRIKHYMGKLESVCPAKTAIENIEQIHKLLN